MKYVILVANVLIGLVFLVFGLNGFLHFVPMPPMDGDAGTFAGVLVSTGFMYVIKAIEVICGAMILFNFQRPLAYVLIAPIVIGILLFELLIAKQPGIGLILTALIGLLIYSNRSKYMSILS